MYRSDLTKSLERIIQALIPQILGQINETVHGTAVSLHTVLKPKVEFPNRKLSSPKVHIKNVGFTFISDLSNSMGDLKSADRMGDIASYIIFNYFRSKGVDFIFQINRRSWKSSPVDNPSKREWIFEFELPNGLKTNESLKQYETHFLELSDRLASPHEEMTSSSAEQVLRDALRERDVITPSSNDFLWIRMIASLCHSSDRRLSVLAKEAWKSLENGIEMFNTITNKRARIEISLTALGLVVPDDEKAKSSFKVLHDYLLGKISRQEFARYEMTTFHSHCLTLQRLYRSGRGNWKAWIPLYVAISRAETHNLEPLWMIDYLISSRHLTSTQVADVVKIVVPDPGAVKNGN